MRFDIREPKRFVSSIEFDRWFNGGRRVKSMPDKLCRLRKHVSFARILHKNSMYGQDRGVR